MIELMTSATDSWLSITIFRPVVPRKGSLIGFLSVLHHTSLIISSEFSSSLHSSSIVLVSLLLVTTMTEDRNYLCELVGTSLSLSKLSLSLWSETSECISAYNSHKISSSCRPFLCNAIIATEEKQREYLNKWSLCCSLMVLKIGGHDRSVCNLRPKYPASRCW